MLVLIFSPLSGQWHGQSPKAGMEIRTPASVAEDGMSRGMTAAISVGLPLAFS